MKIEEDKFSRILNRVDEFTSTVLNGHLLIEEQLNSLISDGFPQGEHLRGVHFRFFEKIKIAKAFYYSDEDRIDWELLEKLNSLRNLIAHKLENPRIKEKVLEISKIIGGARIEEKLKSTREFDIETVWIACAMVYSTLERLNKSAESGPRD